MKVSVWTLYLRMFYKPKSTFTLIFDSTHTLKLGLYALLVPMLGYTLFYVMAYFAGGSPSTFKPWLAIPMASYFKFDRFK